MTHPLPKIIVTGSNGLIGSKFTSAYRSHYRIVPFDLSNTPSVDITDPTVLRTALDAHPDATAVVHFAAYTDVSGAFAQTGDRTGPAWRINVDGTHYLATLCAKRQLHLVHLSTAYVFAGDKTGLYTEDDPVHPIEWYGQTKAESETRVIDSGAPAVILRLDQPFSATPFIKTDTLHRIITGLQAGTLYPQFTDHFFGPTYIEDLCQIIDFALRQRLLGLYHASSGEQWSDFAFAQAIQNILNLDGEVKPGNLDDYLRTTKRPYQRNTAMSNQKLALRLDFTLHTIKEAISATQL